MDIRCIIHHSILFQSYNRGSKINWINENSIDCPKVDCTLDHRRLYGVQHAMG